MKCATSCGSTDSGEKYVWYEKDSKKYCTEEVSCNDIKDYPLTPVDSTTSS